MKRKLYIAVTYNTKEPWHIRKWKGSFGISLGKSMSHSLLSVAPPHTQTVKTWNHICICLAGASGKQCI